MTTSSLRPLVFTLSSFLSDKEMDYIIQKSKPKMSRSSVSKMDGDVDRDSTEFRTSRTFFLKSQEGDSILQSIDARVANITGTSLQQQEIMQVDLYHPSIHPFMRLHVYATAYFSSVVICSVSNDNTTRLGPPI
jgi:hypothetical protein